MIYSRFDSLIFLLRCSYLAAWVTESALPMWKSSIPKLTPLPRCLKRCFYLCITLEWCRWGTKSWPLEDGEEQGQILLQYPLSIQDLFSKWMSRQEFGATLEWSPQKFSTSSLSSSIIIESQGSNWQISLLKLFMNIEIVSEYWERDIKNDLCEK